MSESSNQGSRRQANISPINRVSKIWLVPFVALLIGIWIIIQEAMRQGPEIQIAFETAQGLEAGKTKIKIRDVEIGLVEEVSLNKSSTGVVAKARINKEAAKFLTTDTQFWIVLPRITFGGISGLQTLLSGAYIDMAPGQEEKSERKFIALSKPPVTPIGTPGLRILLSSKTAFTFKEGDQIIYQGMPVGRIETVSFDLEQRIAYYDAFVESPFHTLVTENTRFWNASGLELQLSADGIDIKTGSLAALLSGGIEFDVPVGMDKGDGVSENTQFEIYTSYENAVTQHYKEKVYYLLFVSDSVRGLRPGAPVEYRGLKIGQVEEVNSIPDVAEFQTTIESFDIPVLISIQPARVNLSDDDAGKAYVIEQTDIWLKQGLRATLKTGNLVTGAVFVDLQHRSDVEPYKKRVEQGYTVIPMVQDGISELTQQVNSALAKVNAIPLDDLTQDMQKLMQSLAQSALAFETAGNSVSTAFAQFDMAGLNASLVQLNQLLEDYSSGSEGFNNINTALEDIQTTMKELTPLLQKLNNKPNSLIFNSSSKPDIEPRGVEQ